ncbi:flavin reductase family protein [Herminiimonas contaminans]|uniref:Flavin reductase family protein n=1 Tax=Herminiimonas contaminans TaxID=1111140 RepID=A0ABS0EYT0_9BURK|nr:flavin reductase family protein [Herminiimonas contaminans]MBF8178633.1 flavin reductase family protein [Herminiimonas contaminans]
MFLDFAKLTASDAYRWMSSTITPRPIAWVSTLNKDGAANLAPFSFFQMITGKPPTLMISPLVQRDGRLKDTVNNIQATGEFVVNLVSLEQAVSMNQTSGSFAAEIDEFALCDIANTNSVLVKPKRVANSPVSFECRMTAMHPYPPDAPSCHIILGQVLAMHIEEELIAMDGKLANDKLNLISRLGGDWYGQTISSGNFELYRPE